MHILKILYDNFYYPVVLGKSYPVHPYRLFKHLLKTQYWKRSDITEYQNEKINDILYHAKNNIPFYRNQIINKVFFTTAELKILPALTKEKLKQEPENIYKKSTGKEYRHVTSGSTGDPLVIKTDGETEAHRIAHRLRFYQWWGIKPSDRNILIWGQTEEAEQQNPCLIKKLKRKLFQRTYFINVFKLNSKTIHKYYKELCKFKPQYIRGYKSAIHQFARLLDQEKLDASKFQFKVVITTSEILFPEERQYIEQMLHTRVADEFGAAEIGLFSVECPEGGRHICEELNYIYTNDNNELLVTDLHNKVMPLINYKIGDRIQINDEPCSCGRTSYIIKNIEGRLNTDIKKENGEEISQYLFYYAVKNLDNLGLANSILKYKVVQNELHFDFYLIKGENFTNEVTSYLEKHMRKNIGPNISVNFHTVEDIPLDKNGKLQFFKRIK